MQPVICQPAADPSLFTAEGVVGLIFLFLIAMVVTGGIIATLAKRLIRAVAGLAVCFTGVAGIYYFLLSPFVAMMQMLIYVGAVAILIAFAIMLAEPEYKDSIGSKIPPLAGPLGFSVGALFFAAFTLLGINTKWQVFPREGTGDMHHLGITLLTTHSLVFELISIVLLIAIIGALVVARRGRD